MVDPVVEGRRNRDYAGPDVSSIHGNLHGFGSMAEGRARSLGCGSDLAVISNQCDDVFYEPRFACDRARVTDLAAYHIARDYRYNEAGVVHKRDGCGSSARPDSG